MKLNRVVPLLVLVIVAAAAAFAILSNRAPDASSVVIATPEGTADAPDCLSHPDGGCIVFPMITGQRISGGEFTTPSDFSGRLNVVIVPFDRNQQERALAWLPTAQALAAERDDLAYYSIAALPDLAPLVRTLVISGLDVGVREAAVREATVVAFLEAQDAFIAALGLPDAASLVVLLVDDAGRVLYRATGDYSEAGAAALRAAADEAHSR